jgi:hypothetical protein
VRIRTYLTILVLAAVVPLLTLTAFVTISLSRQQLRVVNRGLADTVAAVAATLQNELETPIRSLETLATSQTLDRDDLKAFYEQAMRVRDLHGWSTIGLVDANGLHLVNVARPFGAALPYVRDRDYFRMVVETGKPYVSDLLKGRATNTIDVGVAVPVMRAGRLKYVLFAGVNPARFAEVLGQTRAVPDRGVFGVVGRDGIFIARHPDHVEVVGRTAVPEYLRQIRERPVGTFAGRTLIRSSDFQTAYVRMPLTDWTVSYGLPIETINAPVRRVVQFSVLVGASTIIVSIVLSVIVARRMARALETRQLPPA